MTDFVSAILSYIFAAENLDKIMAKQVVDFRPLYNLSEETSRILLRTADDSIIRQKKTIKLMSQLIAVSILKLIVMETLRM